MRFQSLSLHAAFIFLAVFIVQLLPILDSLNSKTCPAQESDINASVEQEFFELRIYRIDDHSKMLAVGNYLEHALIPALNRMGVDRIGVFTNKGDVNDHSYFVLIPHKSIKTFTDMNAELGKDKIYQSEAKTYFDRPLKDPLYSRIESRLMKSFSGMPKIQVPSQTDGNQARIFELRLYESHTEGYASRKIEMFNSREIEVMKECQMGPVFFGETLIGPDVPNLIYMLSASNEEEHANHWKSFLKHPKWLRMKELEQYKDTVSKIKKWVLQPTDYSKI